MTARVGIIGYPLGHSISPAFQQAALDELEIDARYVAWPTPPEELAARVDSLRASDVLGANVTVPHKQAVMPMLDEVLPVAESIGAVNTIINRDGLLIGANTDASGFTRSLEQEAKFSAARKRALDCRRGRRGARRCLRPCVGRCFRVGHRESDCGEGSRTCGRCFGGNGDGDAGRRV